MRASTVKARTLSAIPLHSRRLGESSDNRIIGIADIGDSTIAYGLGFRWSSDAPFFARSNSYGLAEGDGTLTIYSNGTAKWAAPGDTAGAVVSAGEGCVWLESGSANKGMGFCIAAEEVAAASPSGTDHVIAVLPGNAGGSITGYEGKSGLIWASALTGFKCEIAGIHGFPGQTTAKILASLQSGLLKDSFGKALTSRPRIVHISVGINNWTHIAQYGEGDYTIASVLANLTAIKNEVNTIGAIAVFASYAHEAPSVDLWALMQTGNAHLAAMAAADPQRVKVADYYASIHDPAYSDGRALPGMMSNPHYNAATGCKICGEVLADVINDITGSRVGRSPFLAGAPNAVANGAMQGTDGVLTGATGVSAWDVVVAGMTVVASKESVAGENPWQVYEIEGASGGYMLAYSDAFSVVPGDLHSIAAEIYVSDDNDLGAGFFTTPRLAISYFDSMDVEIGLIEAGFALEFTGDITGGAPFSGVFKTYPIEAPAGAVTAKLVLVAQSPDTASAVIKIRNAGARKVS